MSDVNDFALAKEHLDYGRRVFFNRKVLSMVTWLNLISNNPLNKVFAILIVGIFIVSFVFFIFSEKKRAALIASYVPSVLTTLGILGTFVGICLGLMEFDPSSIKQSTPQLIDGLRTAFLTSVLGLVTSMVFRMVCFIKFYFSGQESGYQNPLQNVDDNLGKILDCLISDKETNQATFEEIRAFRRQSESDAKEIKSGLNQFLQNAAENNSKALIEALESVMKDFNSKINEQFGDNFKQLNLAVEKLVDWQDNYLLQMEGSDKAINASIESFKSSSELFTTSAKTLTELGGLSESLDKSINENSRVLLAMKDAIVEIENIGKNAEKVIPSINENLNRITTEFGEQVQVTVAKTSEFVELQNSQYKKAFESLRDNMKQNQTQMDTFLKKSTDEALRSVSQVSSKQEENISRQLKAIDEAMGQELTKAMGLLGSNLSTLSNHFVSDYKPLTESLRKVVEIANSTKIAS